MGKLLFLGVTALLAVRYITKTTKNLMGRSASPLPSPPPVTIDQPPQSAALPPAER